MRDIIVLTAREKIVQYGWRKFTINHIAADLGISKKTVYKYFNSKDEIISAVMDRFIDLEKANSLKVMESEMSWAEKMRTLMGATTPDKPAWVIGELERFFPQEWVKIEEWYKFKREQRAELFAKAVENGEIRSDIAPEVIFLTMSCTFKALHNYTYLGEINLTLNQAVREFAKILYSGILSKEARESNTRLGQLPPAYQEPNFNNASDDLRGSIIQAAREKINQYGWRKFTIDDVAAKLGISKKTVYKHFISKDEIISAAVDACTGQEKAGALKALETTERWTDKLMAVSGSFTPPMPAWVIEELERYFPQEWAKVQDMRKQRQVQAHEIFVKAIENGEIRSDIAPGIVSLVITSVGNELLNHRNLDQINMTFNQAWAEFNKIVYTGILTKKGHDIQ